MNAPNRSAEVAAWVAAHPERFVRPSPEIGADDVRRRALVPLCQWLNLTDAGKWGRLLKTNRGNTIPHDIIVWKDTDEHFDVFTGTSDPEDTKARWGPNAPREGWTWISVEDVDDVPAPPADPPPVPPADDALARRVALLEATVLAQAGSITALRNNLVDVLEALMAVTRRLENLDVPAPPFELPPLVAEGTTGRVFGHGHPVRLTVRRA
jgi:hypothetical protein